MDPQCLTQIYSSINAITIHPKLQSDSRDDKIKGNEEEERDSPESHSNSSTSPDPSISFLTKKVLKLNSLFESLGLVPPSPNVELVFTKEEDGDVMFIEIIPKDDDSRKEEPKVEGQEVEYLDIFPTRSELAYHKVVDDVLQPVAPTTAEQKLARKNELKARGASSESLDQIHDRLQKLVSQLEIHRVSLSQEDVNLKFLRSLPSEWKTHTLIWRNTADSKEQSLDDLFNTLKIFEAEVKHFSSTGTTSQNLAFVSSSNTDNTVESVSATVSVFAICAKMPMAMLTMRARRFLQKIGRNLKANGPTSMGFDMSKVECYNCHKKGHFARECRSLKDSRRTSAVESQRRIALVETSTSNALVSQCDSGKSYDWSSQAEKEPANYALMAFSSLSSSSDNEVPSCSKACSKAYAQLHSQYDKLTTDFHKSQFVVISYQAGAFMPPKPELVFNTAPTDVETDHSAFTSTEQEKSPRHFVQHVETSIPVDTPKPVSPKTTSSGKRGNIRACFVCKSLDHLIKDCDCHAKKMAQPTPRNHLHRADPKQYAPLTHQNPYKHMVPAAVLTQSKPISITVVRSVSAAVSNIKVTRPRHAKLIVTKTNSPIRKHLTYSLSPKVSNSSPRVTTVKASLVSAAQGMKGKRGNPQHALKDNGVINSGCSRHMTRNMSYLSDFKELNVLWDEGNSVTKPHNKTPYELLHGRTPSIGFMRPFGFPVTILNTLDSLGKFDREVDEGFLVGYSVSSKAVRVFNSRTRIVQETLHVNFLENKPNVVGSGPIWLFDIDSLIRTMNYQPVTANNDRAAAFDGKEPDFDAKKLKSEVNVSPSSRYRDLSAEFEDCSNDSINKVNAAGTIVPTVGQNSPNSTNTFSAVGPSNAAASLTYRKSSFLNASQLPDDPDMPELEDITYFDGEDDVGVEADFNNLETSITVSPIPTIRVHKDHPVLQIIGDLSLTTQTRSMTKVVKDQETKRVHQDLKDPSLIEAMQEELLQFKMQKDEGIDYEEVFALVPRIEAIRLFLAYASFMGFIVYQMDVKSAFQYGTIEEEVYVCQTLGFEDPDHPEKVYKVVKALYGLHQAPRAWYETLANYLLDNGFQRVKQKKDGIFVSQEKYVAEILRKFRLTKGKSASTPIDTEKPLLKDPDGENVDVHTYRLISWQYKKKIVVSTSSIEAEYVAATSCCAQVLWIQNQLLDYGYNFMHTIIYIDNNSTIWQRATGNEISNPFMAGGVNTPRNDDDRLELMELTVFLLPKVKKVRIGVNVVDLQVNDITRSQALVNKNKVVVTKATIREALHLDDAEGCMSAKRTSWNEPSIPSPTPPTHGDNSTAYGKVNPSDAAHEDDSAAHGDNSTAHGKRVETSDDIMMDDESNQGRIIAEMDKDDVVVLEDDKEEDREVVDVVKDVAKEDETKPAEVEEVVEVVTTAKLIYEVTAASDPITTASTTILVVAQVPAVTITSAPLRVAAAPSRRRKGVVIRDPKSESTTSTIIPTITKSKDKGKGIMVEEPKPLKKKQQIELDEQYAKELHDELNKDIDWDEAIDHVKMKAKEDPAIKRYQVLKRKPQTEAQARKNMIMYLKNVVGFKMDYFKGMSYNEIRPIFEAKFNSNVAFLLNTKEQIEDEENRALQKLNETPAESAARGES
nr:hypothetical protein [Tanacetum cinerariifolium]